MPHPFGPGADLLSPRVEILDVLEARLDALPPEALPQDDGLAPDPLGRLLARPGAPRPPFAVGLLHLTESPAAGRVICDAVVPAAIADRLGRPPLRLGLLRTKAACYVVSAGPADAPLPPPDWSALLWILDRATPADPGLPPDAEPGDPRRGARAWGRFAYHPPARARALALPHALGAASLLGAGLLALAGVPALGAAAGAAGLAALTLWPTPRWRPTREILDAAWRAAVR